MLDPRDYCVLVSRQPNRLKLVNAHDEVVQVIKECLSDNAEFYYKSKATCGFVITRPSRPFIIGGSQEDTIKVKRLLAEIVEKLQKISWFVVTCSDVSRMASNFSLFFRKIVTFDQVMKNKLSREGKIFIFSPSGRSSLLLIDTPYFLEKEMIDAIKSQCTINDYKMIENVEGNNITSRIELKGFAWAETGSKAIKLRKMMLEVIRVARKHKYELITNINVKGTTDSLMFQHRPSLPDSAEDLLIMSLNRTDRIRLIGAPPYVVTAAEDVIGQHWGVQSCKQLEDGDGFEFKLYGSPWWADGETAVKSRHLVASLIAKYKSLGWEVGATVDVSRKLNDKTVFVFRQCPPETQNFAVLSFHETDKLRFLSDLDDPFSLMDGIDRILDASDVSDSISYYWKAKQWKIKGVPFSGHMNCGVDLRLMVHHLTKILKYFHKLGWRLVASADVSAKYADNNNQSYPLDTHTWFFLYDPEHIKQSDTVLDIEEEEEAGENHHVLDGVVGDLFTVEEIKSERSNTRYFIRVILPMLVFFTSVLIYIFIFVF